MRGVMSEMGNMITIITNTNNCWLNGWDFPLEEIPYLLQEHNGETFVLVGDRLYEFEHLPTESEVCDE